MGGKPRRLQKHTSEVKLPNYAAAKKRRLRMMKRAAAKALSSPGAGRAVSGGETQESAEMRG